MQSQELHGYTAPSQHPLKLVETSHKECFGDTGKSEKATYVAGDSLDI